MNIDEMKEKEKDASGVGVAVPEGKNSSGSDVAAQTETQDALKKDAEAEKVVVEARAAAEVVASEPPKPVLGPGAQLAAYRIAAGIDQEQVAASLKMTVRRVRELESDNYEALHGTAISRGFIRAYAKMLQVDPEPLVAMFSSEEPATKQLDQIPKQSAAERAAQGSNAFAKKRNMGKTGWIGLIVAVLLVLYAAHSLKWFSSNSFSVKKKTELAAEVKKREALKSASSDTDASKAATPESQKAAEKADAKDGKPIEAGTEKKVEDKPAEAKDAASPEKDKQPDQSQSQARQDKQEKAPQQEKQEKAPEPAQPEKAAAPAAATPVAPAPAATATPAPAATAQAPTPAPVPAASTPLPAPAAAATPTPATAAPAPAAPQHFLVVRFSGPSKVRIVKADSSTLKEMDGRAGDVQKVEITEPVTVVVEKAANVRAEFRKQQLVLRAVRRSPEARVELK